MAQRQGEQDRQPRRVERLDGQAVRGGGHAGEDVQGATTHASLINVTTSEAFSKISLKSGVPVLDGVVSAENLEQAVERCGTKQGNKGFAAMQAAIELVNVLQQI